MIHNYETKKTDGSKNKETEQGLDFMLETHTWYANMNNTVQVITIEQRANDRKQNRRHTEM